MLTVVAILIDKQDWAGLQVEYKQHKDTDNQILKVPDEVVEFLDAHQLELQTMIGMGKFVDYFRTKVVSWQNKLGLVESILKYWSSVTKTWASLEAIFLTSEDIRSQLPDDTKRFEQMDSNFKEVMKNAVDVPNCVEVCSFDGLEENLKEMVKLEIDVQNLKNENVVIVSIVQLCVTIIVVIIVVVFFF